MKFDGRTGRKPQTEARMFVYAVIVSILENNQERSEHGWFSLGDDATEPDRRRLAKALDAVAREMAKKAEQTEQALTAMTEHAEKAERRTEQHRARESMAEALVGQQSARAEAAEERERALREAVQGFLDIGCHCEECNPDGFRKHFEEALARTEKKE